MQDAKGKGFILDRIEQQARVTEVRYEDTYSGPKVNASPHDEGRYLRDPEATTQLLTFARGSERQCSPAAGSYMYRSRDSLEQKPRYRCWKKVITSVNRWGGGQGESWLLAGFVTSPANTKLEHEDSAQETAGSRDSSCVNDTGKEREDYLSKRLGGLFFQTEHLFPSPNSSWSSRGAPGPPTGLFSPSVALPGC